ncbi:potassium-transporting ATPase subunit KdpA [Paraburkholderia sp. RAU2J]|uniref:potassium-transporting ATPase subunit KdpA n=1 Tax=Paraburkholderia sp. RAU2J TaxID=1938810 RepID=UPI001F54469F|nr:potassium-transporting ATPase subunit KdpA [Paraburkholderia sp. RAU2J]
MAGHPADAGQRCDGHDTRRPQTTYSDGPIASLESIKHLGTNGGGFFGMNAAHPFENPTPLTNTVHILRMLLIPSALCARHEIGLMPPEGPDGGVCPL